MSFHKNHVKSLKFKIVYFIEKIFNQKVIHTKELNTVEFFAVRAKYTIRRRRNKLLVYRNSISRSLTRKISVIFNKKMNESPILTEVKVWDENPMRVSNYGGFIKLNGFFQRILNHSFYHIVAPLQVFHRDSIKEQFFGSYKNFHSSAQLVTLRNVEIECNSLPESLSKYRFKIRQVSKNDSIKLDKSVALKKVFVLDHSGAESFQHFILDALPVLLFAKEFLIYNQDIEILLPMPSNFMGISDWLHIFGIENKLRFFSRQERSIFRCEEIYYINFMPRNYIVTHQNLYQNMHQLLPRFQKEFVKDKAIFFTRNSETRKLINLDEVLDYLWSFFGNIGVEFAALDPSVLSPKKLLEEVSQIKYAFSVHGGEGINGFLMKKNSYFFEWISTTNSNNFAHFYASCGINYHAMCYEGSIFDTTLSIDLKRLKKICSHLFANNS